MSIADVIWKPIAGYEGLYEVNNYGEVRRLAGFWCRKTRPVKLGLRLRPRNPRGMSDARVSLWKDGNSSPKRRLMSRLVYETFVGPIPDGLTINHLNGNSLDNRPENLAPATMREQMRHAYATGLQVRAKGEARTNVAKLTDAAVEEIRRTYKFRVVTGKQLAAKFGVSPACIWSVVRRDRWSHI